VTPGLNYEYDVQASAADSDGWTYALSGAPSWLSIDQNGRITGSPGIASSTTTMLLGTLGFA
jgi:putative Ig domain-containing protein